MPLAPTLSTLCTRRAWLSSCSVMLGGWALPALALPPKTLQFPRDFGSHPELGTEWWYITGHVQAQGKPWGFQLTFFRSRVAEAQSIQSSFAAKQLLFAHAALSNVQSRTLLHDQRMAREGMGLANASVEDTHVFIQDWALQRLGVAGRSASQASTYLATLRAQDFSLELTLSTTQPVLLQGDKGLSRKGPDPQQASYYYSQPQLQVEGHITVDGQRMPIENGNHSSTNQPINLAWLDHECSTALMHPEAQGWDWIGMNLQDGSALTAFHLRRSDGSALWAGGSFRPLGDAPMQVFNAHNVHFTPLQWWISPVTKTRYPVRWKLETPTGNYVIRALFSEQELDSRATTGAIYWEGLSELLTLPSGANVMDETLALVGKGYLEMTGYASPLILQSNQ